MWEFRFYETDQMGGRQRRTVMIGTREEYPTESAAKKSPVVQAILLRINADQPAAPGAATFGAVIARYVGGRDAGTTFNTHVVSVANQQSNPAPLGGYATKCRQANGGRRLAEELGLGSQNQESCSKSDAHNFSVC